VRAHALVLAAGQGRRFGGGKLLASYRGRPLLSYVLDLVSTACRHGIVGGGHVVVATQDHRARTLIEKASLPAILNDAPDLGLSHSVRLGLSTLEDLKDEDVGAALVFLADQPLVGVGVVERLIAAWHGGNGPIVRPRYRGSPHVPGHPTLLDRSVWPLARQLEGDRGFASLQASAASDIFLLDVPGDNPDVDTPADLHALEEFPP
jgi:molybdenum cofactor cytidylyltransferase